MLKSILVKLDEGKPRTLLTLRKIKPDEAKILQATVDTPEIKSQVKELGKYRGARFAGEAITHVLVKMVLEARKKQLSEQDMEQIALSYPGFWNSMYVVNYGTPEPGTIAEYRNFIWSVYQVYLAKQKEAKGPMAGAKNPME